MPTPVTPIVSATPPSPDPRVGLKAGYWDAAQAAWNMKLVSATAPGAKSLGEKPYGDPGVRIPTHSDLAFSGKYVIQGNYNGFEIYDITNPAKPVLAQTYVCPASQNDVSVYKNLIFMSAEATNSRSDCGFGGVPDPVSKDRVRGIRVFDISNIKAPQLVTSVQTCRGSHTHTVVTQPGDNQNVYIYVSGTAGVRSADELSGCMDGGPDDPNSARFRLEVIKVPLDSPAKAAIVSSPRIFNALPVAPRNPERDAAGRAAGPGGAGAAPGAAGAGAPGAAGAAPGAAPAAPGAAGAAPGAAGAAPGAAGEAGGGRGRGPQGPPTGPNQCHDITVYPEIGLAGGACAGLGLLIDIKNAAQPQRIDYVADANMSFWHSATFNNDGTKVLFSDEWGGGSAPRCRDTDKMEWGADAIFTIENGKMKFHKYYKLPAAQTNFENCVAHNGSLIPIPGRDVMVQGWYQGGVSVFDWTDPDNPHEIAYFDRGPVNGERLTSGGSWSAYWYNGVIVSSEIARGLDIYELVPGPIISQNEIDAAKTVKFTYWNVQDQQKFTWPPSFALVKAYLDQLERSRGLPADRLTAVRGEVAKAEKASGGARRTALRALATSLNADVNGSSDQAKVKMLAAAVTDLASPPR
jgi:LVIVD repeat